MAQGQEQQLQRPNADYSNRLSPTAPTGDDPDLLLLRGLSRRVGQRGEPRVVQMQLWLRSVGNQHCI